MPSVKYKRTIPTAIDHETDMERAVRVEKYRKQVEKHDTFEFEPMARGTDLRPERIE